MTFLPYLPYADASRGESLGVALSPAQVADIIAFVRENPGTWAAQMRNSRLQAGVLAPILQVLEGLSPEDIQALARLIFMILRRFLAEPLTVTDVSELLSTHYAIDPEYAAQLMIEALPAHLELLGADGWEKQLAGLLEARNFDEYHRVLDDMKEYVHREWLWIARALAQIAPVVSKSGSGSMDAEVDPNDVVNQKAISVAALSPYFEDDVEAGGLGSWLKKGLKAVGKAVKKAVLPLAKKALPSVANMIVPGSGMLLGAAMGGRQKGRPISRARPNPAAPAYPPMTAPPTAPAMAYPPPPVPPQVPQYMPYGGPHAYQQLMPQAYGWQGAPQPPPRAPNSAGPYGGYPPPYPPPRYGPYGYGALTAQYRKLSDLPSKFRFKVPAKLIVNL